MQSPCRNCAGSKSTPCKQSRRRGSRNQPRGPHHSTTSRRAASTAHGAPGVKRMAPVCVCINQLAGSPLASANGWQVCIGNLCGRSPIAPNKAHSFQQCCLLGDSLHDGCIFVMRLIKKPSTTRSSPCEQARCRMQLPKREGGRATKRVAAAFQTALPKKGTKRQGGSHKWFLGEACTASILQ